MMWQPHQWHPQTLHQMEFLMVILASVPLTKARRTFPEKLDQVLVPQVPDSGIKCMECPCVNPCPCVDPCAQHPPPPSPPPPPTFPSTQFCRRLALPQPPRLTYTKSDLEEMGNLNDTDSSNVGLIIVIVILVLVGLGVLLSRCAGPFQCILEKICCL